MAEPNLPYNNRIIFYGECIDNKDPLGLGRIRAILKTENTTDRENSVRDGLGITDNEKWTSKDPFVVRPLLPVFLNIIPKTQGEGNNATGEYVHLIYSNSDDKDNRDKFYISGIHSSLTMINQEPYESAVKNANLGSRDKERRALRNKKTGDEDESNINTKGVYPKPTDIAINGRGSADIVIKNDTVLLRAGKFNTEPTPNVYPIASDKRAFVQLTKFNEKITYGSPRKYFKFKFEHKPIKLLVEYNIQNPENNGNPNVYTGAIYIYTLKPSEKTGTRSFDISTVLDDDDKSLYYTFQFTAITKEKVIELTNSILQGIVDGLIPNLKEITPSVSPVGPYRLDKGLSFPFYFRPQPSLYAKLISDTSTTREKIFISNLMSGIKVTDSANGGYGLIYDDTKQDTAPFVREENIEIPKNVQAISNTAGIMGGDYLYLLSHNSKKKGGDKINLSDTLYGIESNFVTDNIEPNTSSMVRGEELIELLDLIVQFLIGHVHPYHGMVPDSQSVNGVKFDDLLSELRNANEKILNKYIRIN